jgi:hypothetical protein
VFYSSSLFFMLELLSLAVSVVSIMIFTPKPSANKHTQRVSEKSARLGRIVTVPIK